MIQGGILFFLVVRGFLGFAEVGKHWVDEFEGLVDFLADLGSGKHDFAADEDEQDDFRLHHTVNLRRASQHQRQACNVQQETPTRPGKSSGSYDENM